MKIGIYSCLNEYMKIFEYKSRRGLGHSLTFDDFKHYMVKTFKNLLLQNQVADGLETRM